MNKFEWRFDYFDDFFMLVILVGDYLECVESCCLVIDRDFLKGIVEIKGVVVEGFEYILVFDVVNYFSD